MCRIRLLVVLLLSVIGRGHALVLSPEYSVTWDYDSSTSGGNVTFEVVVETRGFVGFGLSPTGGMTSADIVIGGVGSDGTPYFMDYHGVGPQAPIVDESQDWFLISAAENDTHTTLKFWRELNTCDGDDWIITMDTQKMIWSWGASDVIQYHGVNRGTKLRNLLDPTHTSPDLSKYKVWNAFNTITVPARPTTYWCSIHKTPNFTTTHHMIGFDVFLPNDVAVRHTHHVDVYGCRADDPELIFEKWVGDEGRDCYAPDPAKPDFPAHYCDLIELGWVLGGEITLFPEHAGFPFEPNTYIMLEAHYDNPQSLDNIAYEMGYQIYYTDQLREYDAGYLLVGSVVSYTQMIPPNSVNFTQVAHCSPWCTNNFPATGLQVFAFLFHAHTSARGMKVRLFRDGEELEWVLHDAHFDFNYQQNRLLREEFSLLPGDHITVECLYDSTWKEGEATIGGRSTREEMCMAYFFYYPNLPEVAMCNSEMPAGRLLQFLGVESVELEGEWQEDPTVTGPPQYAGQSFTSVIQGLNWTDEMRAEYQNMHRYGYHELECFPKQGQSKARTSYPPYPEWQPVDSCAATK